MNYSKICQSLNHVELFLKPILQQNLIRRDNITNTITWNNRKPGIFNNVYYPIEYQSCIDDFQYSLLLNDGSFFQFYYEFNNSSDNLKKAKLAFYPSPIDSKSSLDDIEAAAENAIEYSEELYNHLENWIQLLEIKKYYPANTSQIRFDYDSEVKSHEKSHLQFSGVNQLRIPAGFFPLPYAFVHMVLDLINNCSEMKHEHLNFSKHNYLNTGDCDKIITLKII
ncbi:DUF2290 domain-containing protein [Providencia rettgeri]|uniref:DUF2290 domain-containing protein n=1 Tax=Providencia rettgeri TaxID=587 RepID=UPI001F03B4DB|nr:DUF2290 domain-containing protein [Providencia rettgeri]MCG9940554.1 DUF2290 domain-containing protein [Providencia rettgeri]